jgi:hypothetical protein
LPYFAVIPNLSPPRRKERKEEASVSRKKKGANR